MLYKGVGTKGREGQCCHRPEIPAEARSSKIFTFYFGRYGIACLFCLFFLFSEIFTVICFNSWEYNRKQDDETGNGEGKYKK